MSLTESDLLDVASKALESYPLDVKEVSLINNEYNATFKVIVSDGEQFALRVNINSPRTAENLKAEVSWVNHLHKDGRVKVAKPITSSELLQ